MSAIGCLAVDPGTGVSAARPRRLAAGDRPHRPTSSAGESPSGEETLPFPHRHVHQRELAALAASGRHRAVVVSTGGRVALPAAWAGARRAGVPVILWSALWAHPRTAAHAFSYLALRRLYRSAEAVVVYGPHVEAYVRARGARNVHIAPQSVDNEFWSHPLTPATSPTMTPGVAVEPYDPELALDLGDPGVAIGDSREVPVCGAPCAGKGFRGAD